MECKHTQFLVIARSIYNIKDANLLILWLSDKINAIFSYLVSKLINIYNYYFKALIGCNFTYNFF